MENLRKLGGVARRSVLRHLTHNQGHVGVATVPVPRVACRGMASSKLFVGGLAWGVDEKVLKDAFSTFGDVTEVATQHGCSIHQMDVKGSFSNGDLIKEAYVKQPLGFIFLVRIIYDRDSGRSRGFGFVHFSNEHNAEDAKNGMDGKELLGRPVRIDYAIDKTSSGGPRIVPRLSPLDPGFERTNTDSKGGDLLKQWDSL